MSFYSIQTMAHLETRVSLKLVFITKHRTATREP